MSKKIAHLGTVTLDTKLATSKQLNADEILANGEDVAEMFNREHTYREMETRVKLEPEDNYILYTDDGTVVTANLSGVANGTRLFYNQTKLTEIPLSWKLDSITDGTSMCASCTNLTSFLHPLTSLSNGSNMFYNCNLNEESVENILTTIPEYTSGSHTLTMYINAEAVVKFNEITGNLLPLSSTTQIVPYKGWEISTIVIGLPTNYKAVAYLQAVHAQYMDTGFVPNNESGVKLKLERFDYNDYVPMGMRDHGHRFYPPRPQATQDIHGGNAGYGWNSWIMIDPGIRDLTISELNWENCRKAKLYNNKEIKVYNLSHLGFEPLYSVYIFAVNARNTPSYNWYGTIYFVYISQGNNVVHKYIPCVDDLGNPCMYDLITKDTLLNLGDDGFIVPGETTTYSLRRPAATFAQKTPHGIRRLYHVPEDYEGSEEEYAQEFGFKQLVENERPKKGSWRPEWVETDNELILNWIEVEEEELTNV